MDSSWIAGASKAHWSSERRNGGPAMASTTMYSGGWPVISLRICNSARGGGGTRSNSSQKTAEEAPRCSATPDIHHRSAIEQKCSADIHQTAVRRTSLNRAWLAIKPCTGWPALGKARLKLEGGYVCSSEAMP